MNLKKFSWIGIGFAVIGFFLVIRSCFALTGALDVNLHNTYFVIDHMHVGIAGGTILLIFAIAYLSFKLMGRPLNSVLGYIHLSSILISLFLLFKINLSKLGDPNTPRRYYKYVEQDPWIDWNNFETIQKVISISAFVFLGGIVLLLVNVIISLVKKKKPI